MAFSNTPTNDTYSSHELQMMFELQLVPSVTDLTSQRKLAGAINVFPFKDEKGHIYGETRYAIQAQTVTWPNDGAHVGMTALGANAIVRGMYVWYFDPVYPIYYLIIDDDANAATRIYNLDTNPAHAASATWFSGGGGDIFGSRGTTPCRFCEFTNASGTKSLCVTDGLELHVIGTGGGTASTVVDPDLPSPHIPFPVYIDGYLFLAKADTADIYNSNLNDPTAWTAGDFINAEMFPDTIKALVKVNNYLLAIGQDSCEFFYDAGNPTGSPLARLENATLPFGTHLPNTIAYSKDTVMFLATNGLGEYGWKVIEGFKATDFPGKAVINALNAQFTADTTNPEKLRSGFFFQEGKPFYFLAFDGSQADTGWTTETVVASLECKMWVRTRSDLYNASTPTGQFGFPMLFTHTGVVTTGASTSEPYTHIAGQMSVTGKVFFGRIDPTIKYDMLDAFNQYSIFQEMIIPPQNFGTKNRKFMSRLGVNYLVETDTASNSSTGIKISWSDDFGQNWLGGVFLQGDTLVDQGYPFVTQLGSFRSRAIKVNALDNRIVWYTIEVDINKGQQ